MALMLCLIYTNVGSAVMTLSVGRPFLPNKRASFTRWPDSESSALRRRSTNTLIQAHSRLTHSWCAPVSST